MELVVATSNNHKLQELRKILPKSFNILGLSDIGFTGEIPETGLTFQENAFQKVHYLRNHLNCEGLADDSGLEVVALNGQPGVLSARYAGISCTSQDNIAKLLAEMKGIENRRARFVTVLALVLDGNEYSFEGVIDGRIANTPSGKEGFGYDPVFVPEGYNKTFAEFTADEKNQISHRAIATGKLRGFLEEYVKKQHPG